METSIIKYSHKVLRDKHLIIEVLTGNFTIEAMRVNREILYSDQYFNPGFDILQDIRNANMNFTYDELSAYLKQLSNAKALGERKTVILTNPTSKEMLLGWFDTFRNIYPVNFNVFTSFTETLKWLGREDEIAEIKKETEVLQKSSGPSWLKGPNAFTGF